jgi:hypothetical protein
MLEVIAQTWPSTRIGIAGRRNQAAPGIGRSRMRRVSVSRVAPSNALPVATQMNLGTRKPACEAERIKAALIKTSIGDAGASQ